MVETTDDLEHLTFRCRAVEARFPVMAESTFRRSILGLKRREIAALENFPELELSFVSGINRSSPVVGIRPDNIDHELDPMAAIESAFAKGVSLSQVVHDLARIHDRRP
jgi:hypothetical protein